MLPFCEASRSDTALVSLDWLALSCKTSGSVSMSPSLPSGWSVLPQSATSVWSQRWFVLDAEGSKVATLLWQPRSVKFLDPSLALLEVANRWLYADGLDALIDLLTSAFCLSVVGISRVDICCDFEVDKSAFKLIRSLQHGSAYVEGFQRGGVWWSTLDGLKYPHQLEWGAFESDRRWKLYHKWKELTQDGAIAKPYIVDCWRALGLRPEFVWRLEVSLKRCNKLEFYDGSKPSFPSIWFNRADIWKSLYTHGFVQRLDQKHVNRRLDKRVSVVGNVENQKLLRYSKPSGISTLSDPQLRLVRKLWEEYTSPDVQNTSTEALLSSTIADMCTDVRVMKYLTLLTGKTASAITHGLTQTSKCVRRLCPPINNDTTNGVDGWMRDTTDWLYPSDPTLCPLISYLDRHNGRLDWVDIDFDVRRRLQQMYLCFKK